MQLEMELIPMFRPHILDRFVKELGPRCDTAKKKLLREIRKEQLKQEVRQ